MITKSKRSIGLLADSANPRIVAGRRRRRTAPAARPPEHQRASLCSGHRNARSELDRAPGLSREGSGGLHLDRARALGAGFDLEGHVLAADQLVEVDRSVKPVAVKEVVLAIVGGDETEPTIGDDLLDTSVGHC